jgi:enoyl-CoA hydratase/carnithine racemase
MSQEPHQEADPDDCAVVLTRINERICLITLNRPDKRNAMNFAARSALMDALDECRDAARVIIITGAGPAFCAGADLNERQDDIRLPPPPTPSSRRADWIAVQEAVRRHPAVTIAAVNGYALGGGLTLLNSCDLAVAALDAEIGMPEVSFGFYPGLAGPSTQLRTTAKRAAWMVLTGERINGQTAEAWGLVNMAVPGDQLIAVATGVAERIARYDALTLECCKKALWEIPTHLTDWTAAFEYGESINAQIRERTPAAQSGLARFVRGERSAAQGRHA